MRQQFTDTEVVRLLRASDERQHSQILAYLYQSHGATLMQVIRQHGGTQEDAEDMLAQALFSFFTNVRIGAFQLQADTKVSTYLITLAKYTWLKQVRKTKPWLGNTLSLSDNWLTEAVPDDLETNEQQVIFDELLARLGQRCQALLRAVVDGLSMQEIAIQLGFGNADNAKAHKYQCMQKLKALYAKQS